MIDNETPVSGRKDNEMGRVAAIIEMGWDTRCYEADDPRGIILQAERVQDFACILQMGQMMEGRNGLKELEKLEAFLEKYYDGSLTMEDIRNLNVRLSVGNIVCRGIAETEEEVKALRESLSK